MKLTFKKQKRLTGLSMVAYPNQNSYIKHGKLFCGMITGPSWRTVDNLWNVRFMVKCEEIGREFKWITLSKKTETYEEMKDWVISNFGSTE